MTSTNANAVMTVIINGVMMMFGCRREKLWIAMEYCGGGSMQDIYHGKLAQALCFTPGSLFPLTDSLLAHILCWLAELVQLSSLFDQ